MFSVGIATGITHPKFHEWKSQLTFFLSKPVAPCCASSQAPRFVSSVSLSDFMELLVQLSRFSTVLEASLTSSMSFWVFASVESNTAYTGNLPNVPKLCVKKMNTLKFYKSL